MPKANSGTFGYPGGKTTLAPWIIEHFPKHECYVEPFGGSASVLYQKPRSDIEIYNDLDSALVNLFETIRDKPDELIEWLDCTPYSREIHDKVCEHGIDSDAHTDIERAGVMFYLLQTSYAGNLDRPSFRTQRTLGETDKTAHSPAEGYGRSIQNIRHITSRFKGVAIESLPYSECIDRYDDEGTLFYLDPPYVTGERHYRVGQGFDHTELVDTVSDIEGRFVLSYDILPDGLEGFTVVTRDRKWTVSRGNDETEGTEKLVMNYDPEEIPRVSEPEQSTLTEAVE